MQVVLSILNYVPLATVEVLALTSKDILGTISSKEGMGTIGLRFGCTISLRDTRDKVFRSRELVQAIREDNAHMVLMILSYTTLQDNTDMPTLLLPHVLSLACVYKSTLVFTAVCPLIVPELNIMYNAQEDMSEDIGNYLYHLLDNTLDTCDPVIYETFFSSLAACDGGNDVIWYGSAINMCRIGHRSYLHMLDTGDSSAYGVMRKYYNMDLGPDAGFQALEYTRSIKLLKRVMDSGMYSVGELLIAVSWFDELKGYINGLATYEEVLEREARCKCKLVEKYIEDIEDM